IRLGRTQALPGGLSLEAFVGDGDEIVRDVGAPRFSQQLLDDALAFLVAAFAEVVVANPPFRVGDVDRGPVVIGERLPHAVLAVEGDGYSIRSSCTAQRTLSTSRSNGNSGVWTPTTTNPCSSYFSAHARTYASVRSQLMHVYVQKSTRTTLPRRSSVAS